MSKMFKIFIVCFVAIQNFFLQAYIAMAADGAISNFTTGLGSAATGSGIPKEGDLVSRIGIVLGALLYFAATILLILIIIGGYMWMTAGGNEEQVKKGRKYITNSIIGYIVIAISYLIVRFVFSLI